MVVLILLAVVVIGYLWVVGHPAGRLLVFLPAALAAWFLIVAGKEAVNAPAQVAYSPLNFLMFPAVLFVAWVVASLPTWHWRSKARAQAARSRVQMVRAH